jgi:hypothetical protein
MTGAQAAKHAETTLATAQIEKESFYDGGEYLPLGVWAHRGFNTARIETLSKDEDIREDAVLGKVYRVKILVKGKSIARVHTRSTVQKRKIGCLQDKPGEPDVMLALANIPSPSPSSNSSSDSSSSSSSSSSSDSHKKGKKGKKDKKGKKGKKSKKDKKSKKSKKVKKEKKGKKEKKDISNLSI